MINPVNSEETKKCNAINNYSYRVMILEIENNHILKFRQLFHQYIINICANIETESLIFICLNQTKHRSEEYAHLRDSVLNDGNTTNIGRLTIFPSSYTGCSRDMHEYTQNGIVYVRHYWCLDLFITFTCNTACDDSYSIQLGIQ